MYLILIGTMFCLIIYENSLLKWQILILSPENVRLSMNPGSQMHNGKRSISNEKRNLVSQCADTTTKYGTQITKLQDSPTCATANHGARAKAKPRVMQLCTRNLFCKPDFVFVFLLYILQDEYIFDISESVYLWKILRLYAIVLTLN